MSAATAMTRRLNDAIDKIDTVLYLNNALIMATSNPGVTRDATNALQALAIVIEGKLLDLKGDLEESGEA